MMDFVMPAELVSMSIPGLVGIAVGGTVLSALLLFISENSNMAERRKVVSETLRRQAQDGKGAKPVNDNDLIDFQDLRKLIPSRLFERLLCWSMFFLLVDLAICASLQWLYHHTIREVEFTIEGIHKVPIVFSLDVAFILLCGTCETGLWVAAHECGHHAFSKYEALNDCIGFILHSYLLAPYFTWQYSHGVHHSRNKHIDEDESHNPRKMKPGKKIIEKSERFMKRRAITPIFGWYAYLGFGLTGAKRNRAGRIIKAHSHFWRSELFPAEYPSWKIWLSNIGLLLVLAGIYKYAQVFGWWEAFRKFIGPRIVTNYWLVFITTAQHSHVDMGYLDDKKWTWYLGAIRTIDYDYGATRSKLLRLVGYMFDFVTLHITSTHVCHHLFSHMPHYHCREATPIVAKALGRHYMRPDSSATAAFYLHLYDWVYTTEAADGEYSYAN